MVFAGTPEYECFQQLAQANLPFHTPLLPVLLHKQFLIKFSSQLSLKVTDFSGSSLEEV